MICRPALRATAGFVRVQLRRNLACSAAAAQKASDPIQQMFVEKVREYADKKKRAGGKLVDSTPQLEKELQNELDKVAKAYGGGAGIDMAKFPEFKFTDPKLDDIDLK